MALYSDQTWKKIVLSIFYTLWKYFSGVWRPFLHKAAPWQHATSCGRMVWVMSSPAQLTAQRVTLDVLLSGHMSTKQSLTNKTCTCSLLVNFIVLEIFDHWWLTDWMDINGEIVLSAQCLHEVVVTAAAIMGRARDSWRSKPLALVSREIIGYSKSNLNTTLLFHSTIYRYNAESPRPLLGPWQGLLVSIVIGLVRTKLVRMWNSLGDACVDNRAKISGDRRVWETNK